MSLPTTMLAAAAAAAAGLASHSACLAVEWDDVRWKIPADSTEFNPVSEQVRLFVCLCAEVKRHHEKETDGEGRQFVVVVDTRCRKTEKGIRL